MNPEDWVEEIVSGYDGYRNKKTGEWIYASMYSLRLKNMSQFDTVTEVHIVAFEDASGARHDTKAKAEAANKQLKFKQYYDENVSRDDLEEMSCYRELVEFLEIHKDGILGLLLDKKPD